MNALTQRRIKFYDENYDMVLRHLDDTSKIKIPALKNGECRFCKKSSPDAKFSKEPHAFPELIGNKILISSDECNDCNNLFSETIEDNLAKFLGVQRTIAFTKGKGGVPSYKSPDKQTRWDVGKDGKVAISSVVGDDTVTLDQENKKLTIKTIRQPHIRRSAYKCFVKMALSVMEESDFANMTETVDWLLLREDNIQTNSFIALHTFISGESGFKNITFALFRRKAHVQNVPQYSFFIAWGKFTYQIFLPFAAGDKDLLGKTITMEYFPNVFDGMNDQSKIAYTKIDMSSNKIIRGDTNTITYSFEEVTETNIQGRPKGEA